MKLLLDEQREQLLANGRERVRCMQDGEERPDFEPVVKLFQPDGPGTWLLTEMDPNESDIVFAWANLGHGWEWGAIRLSEIKAMRGPLRLPVERDKHFKPEAVFG